MPKKRTTQEAACVSQTESGAKTLIGNGERGARRRQTTRRRPKKRREGGRQKVSFVIYFRRNAVMDGVKFLESNPIPFLIWSYSVIKLRG